jgi:hypothetical protein
LLLRLERWERCLPERSHSVFGAFRKLTKRVSLCLYIAPIAGGACRRLEDACAGGRNAGKASFVLRGRR